MPDGHSSGAAISRVVGVLRGLNFGGMTSWLGDGPVGRSFQTGVQKELVEGYPNPPCLRLDYPGFWRFRWSVVTGSQTISVYAKQVSNVAGKRPAMIVRANPEIGFAADVSGSAGAGTGWLKIGPLTAVVTGPGVLWVELWNNDIDNFNSPTYFDNVGS